MNYFEHKDEMKRLAVNHHILMEEKLDSYTRESVTNTITYRNSVSGSRYGFFLSSSPSIEIKYVDDTSIGCINKTLFYFSHDSWNWASTAVLNFASYKNPGGMYIEGSSAQEESLCHATNLYEILSRFPDYYSKNKENLMKGLYTDAALYTPRVVTDYRTNEYQELEPSGFTNIITCAAPNKRTYLRFNLTDTNKRELEEENLRVLMNRVKFIIDICTVNNIRYLVAGAYGTGVFGQNPMEVALAFKEAIKKSPTLDGVFFPIPGNDKTMAMRNILGDTIKREVKYR